MRTILTLPGAIAFTFCWTGLFRTSYAEADIVICNQGDVQLYVAMYERFLLIPSSGYFEAWRIVDPGVCKNINSRRDTAVNLVFGLRTQEGEYGIVQYGPRRLPGESYYRQVDSYCVSTEPMRVEGESVEKYLPPCPTGFVAAPTSGVVLIEGGATMTLNVKPTTSDFKKFLAIVQSGVRPKKPTTSSSRTKAAAPSSVAPTTRNIRLDTPAAKMTEACHKSYYDAAVAKNRVETWSSNKTREWCACLTLNLQPILAMEEHTVYMRNAAAFVNNILADPTVDKPRNWRLYTPIGRCRR
jgi:hypothetical protein